MISVAYQVPLQAVVGIVKLFPASGVFRASTRVLLALGCTAEVALQDRFLVNLTNVVGVRMCNFKSVKE